MQALLSRLPDHGASLETKIDETENELKEAEMVAGSKENIGAQLSSRPAVPIAVVDLSAEKIRTTADRLEGQRPKPLGFNNSRPIVSPLPAKKTTVILSPGPATIKVPSVPKAQPLVELPNWSLLSDSPASSRSSPAPTSGADVDDMAEALSSLQLRLH